MTFLPRHPDDIAVHLGKLVRMPRKRRSSAIGVAVRGLLTGVGISVVLITGAAGIGSIMGVGILALGAALLSWDQ
jgi:hypothetical protein